MKSNKVHKTKDKAKNATINVFYSPTQLFTVYFYLDAQHDNIIIPLYMYIIFCEMQESINF